jgi:hypothetical protein
MTDDHRDRRLADSEKLQDIISNLERVSSKTRMHHVHDELMHAIDRGLATHKDHHFETAEIELIKDVAFEIVYILDPGNRPARGFFSVLWREFKTLGPTRKIATIGALIVFLLAAIGGAITIWDRIVKPIITTEKGQLAEPAPGAPSLSSKKQ